MAGIGEKGPPDLTGGGVSGMDLSGNDNGLNDNGISTAGVGAEGGGSSITPPGTREMPSGANTGEMIRVRKYGEGAQAPFIVYVRARKKNSMSICRVSGALFKRYVGIERIEPVNRDKLKIKMTSKDDANKLVDDKDFCNDNFVYIPANKAEISGKIFMNECEDVKDIASEGFGIQDGTIDEIKVVDARRLKKNTEVDGKTVLTPTSFVRVVFEGTILPDYLIVNKLRIPVLPYAPKVWQCNTCLKLGHTADRCGGRKRCDKCGLIHEEGGKTLPCRGEGSFVCPNCLLLYKEKDHKCPKIEEVKDKAVSRAIASRKSGKKVSEGVERPTQRAQVWKTQGVQGRRLKDVDYERNFPDTLTYNRFGGLSENEDDGGYECLIDDESEVFDTEEDCSMSGVSVRTKGGTKRKVFNSKAQKRKKSVDDDEILNAAVLEKKVRSQHTSASAVPVAQGGKKVLPTITQKDDRHDKEIPGIFSCFDWKNVVLMVMKNWGLSENWMNLIEHVVFPCIEGVLKFVMEMNKDKDSLNKNKNNHGSKSY